MKSHSNNKKELHGKCPVCGSPGPIKPLFGKPISRVHMDWRKHVIKKALHEAWKMAVSAAPEGPHVRFYIVHSTPAPGGGRSWTI